MNPIAKQVPGFPGYHVTPCGSVWSTRRRVPVQLAPELTPDGYHKVRLRRGGRRFKRHVGWLVLVTHDGPPRGRECMHLDHDKSNNALRNLAWGTHKRNMSDPETRRRISVGRKHATPQEKRRRLECHLVAYAILVAVGGKQARR